MTEFQCMEQVLINYKFLQNYNDHKLEFMYFHVQTELKLVGRGDLVFPSFDNSFFYSYAKFWLLELLNDVIKVYLFWSIW